jgi:hypothetical protein
VSGRSLLLGGPLVSFADRCNRLERGLDDSMDETLHQIQRLVGVESVTERRARVALEVVLWAFADSDEHRDDLEAAARHLRNIVIPGGTSK